MWGCGKCGADQNFYWRPTWRACGKDAPQKYRRIAAEASRSPSAAPAKGKAKGNAVSGNGGESSKELRELKAELAGRTKIVAGGSGKSNGGQGTTTPACIEVDEEGGADGPTLAQFIACRESLVTVYGESTNKW